MSLRGDPWVTAIQWSLRLLWDVVVPALAAAVVMRFFVPPVAQGVPGIVAELGKHHGATLGVGLFLVFAVLSRYWRFALPGGRYASPLPAHLVADERDAGRLQAWAQTVARYEYVVTPAAARWMSREVAPAMRAEVDEHLAALRSAAERGDLDSARSASSALARMVPSLLDARRRRSALEAIGVIGLAAAAALLVRAETVES